MSGANGIILEPNYEQLFAQFIREAKLQAENFQRNSPDALAALRDLQAILAPLNIAAQSMTRTLQIVDLRAALDEMVKGVQARADRIEEGAETEEEPDEPQEGDITTSDHANFYHDGKLRFQVLDDDGGYRLWIGSDRRPGKFDTIESAVKAYMDIEQFWPDCWYISDHGNAHKMDIGAEV